MANNNSFSAKNVQAQAIKEANKKKGTSQIGNLLLKKKPKKVPICMETMQASIPIQSVHEQYNLIETYDECYTKTYSITNINYQTASESEQDSMLTKWRAFLNSLGSNTEMALTVFNRPINMRQFQEEVLLKETGDGFDNLRGQMNDVLLSRIMSGKNGISRDEFITLAVHTDSLKKATEVFKRLDSDTDKHMKTIGSSATAVPIEEKLEILHDIYNIDNRGEFLTKTKIIADNGQMEEVNSFDFDNIRSQGLSVNDVIGPSSIVIRPKYLEIGSQYVRVLRVTEFPAIMSDSFFSDLTNMTFNMLTTLNVKPIANAEADKLVNSQIAYIREEKHNLQQQNRRNNVDENMINPTILEREDEVINLRDEMRKNDEHLFEVTLTMAIFAPDLALLQEYTDTVISECKKASVTAEILEGSQEEGFDTTLPLCCNLLTNPRTLKSSSCAILVPFSNLEINEPDGINYSMNAVSKNLLVFNRENKANFNGFILGSSGCVDAETEFFDGKEWKSIADYKEGDKVLQFDTNTNKAELVEPLEYIKKKCDKMYHFKTAWGIDQMLSPEHRVIYYMYDHRKKVYRDAQEMSAEELYKIQTEGIFHGRFKTDFEYSGEGIDMSDEEIKVMLMVLADGTFDSRYPHSMRCCIHLKRQRKIEEARKILTAWGEEFNETKERSGYTNFYFNAPRREKTFLSYWYNCNSHQLKLIADNVLNWDGCKTRGNEFNTSIKTDADFIQFVFSSCGYRATISKEDRTGEVRELNGKEYVRKSDLYSVNIAKSTMTGIDYKDDFGNKMVIPTEEKPVDGYKYCFVVPSHTLVLRRNGRLMITGNSGKSFTAKSEIVNVFLKKTADFMIIDPEQEYVYITTKLNGQVIPIMPGGQWHINPLDISTSYEFDEASSSSFGEVVDPILEKVSFIMKLFESMVNKSWGMDSVQKTLIDECLRDLYKPFMRDGRLYRAPSKTETPTLNDMMEWFSKSKEPEARELFFTLKRYAGNGTLNIFSQPTNVEIHNRIVCFDISAVGDELKLMAMNIIQDAIWSRLVENRRINKRTYVYIDEIHLYFQPGSESSAEFLVALFKRARKYNGVCTGITQNTADMVDSPIAKKMLSECNFIQVLNQQSDESRERLKSTLNLSDSALDYITSAPPGQGLLYTGANTVPFFSRFPKTNSDGSPNLIYPLLTSNASELLEIRERERREKLEQEKESKKNSYM